MNKDEMMFPLSLIIIGVLVLTKNHIVWIDLVSTYLIIRGAFIIYKGYYSKY